jgi:uncharacterized protein YaiI (UPF0178 family)
MKILVDADACPVKDIILKHARSRQLRVMMFIDTSHELNDGYSEVIMVDKGRDSADFALISRTEKGDVVVTQDFGVAAMALARGCLVLNQNGLIFTATNIGALLEERHISQKIRRGGGHTSGAKKRTKSNDEAFEQAFLSVLDQ